MASNVHSLLNPADTVERAEPEGEEGYVGGGSGGGLVTGLGEERKRKRIM